MTCRALESARANFTSKLGRHGLLLLAILTLAGIGANRHALAAPAEWLSLCGQCLSPSVTSKSGIGTSKATAEGRITAGDANDWCQNQGGGDPKACVREQMASSEVKRAYRATADCRAGQMVAVDGGTYTLAGAWVGDIGAGRAKFRDAKGQIVGRSNAENGLALAQNWEVLCPGPVRQAAPVATSRDKPVTAPPSIISPGGPAAQFSVGQAIEAKYGSSWVRGRVNAVRPTSTSHGQELAYDVSLENGKHGIVPARMLRQPQ